MTGKISELFKKKHVFATNYVSWQQVSDMIGYEKKNIVRSFSEIRNVHQSAKNKYNGLRQCGQTN